MMNLINKLIKTGGYNRSCISLTGYIQYPNTIVYLDIDISYWNMWSTFKPVINNIHDLEEYLTIDISYFNGGAPLDIDDDITYDLLHEEICNLLLSEIKFNDLKKYNYSKHGYKYVYNMPIASYNCYSGVLEVDENNYLFDINFYE